MFLKKYQSHTHILTISNGMNMSLFPPCFSVLKMYIQTLNYQVFEKKSGFPDMDRTCGKYMGRKSSTSGWKKT